TGGIELVVRDDGVPSRDAADQAEALGLAVVADAALFDDGQRRIESLGEVARLLGEARVSRDDGKVVQLLGEDVARERGLRRQFVYWDVEEALNLPGVQVHRQGTAGARPSDA